MTALRAGGGRGPLELLMARLSAPAEIALQRGRGQRPRRCAGFQAMPPECALGDI